MQAITCHDCGLKVRSGAEYMPYTVGTDEYAKCKACYKKDPVLRNFRNTEVYSRVVGYIRPVNQWNKGKKTEFVDRKVFSVSACCA